jgi:predicted RecB family nuclease
VALPLRGDEILACVHRVALSRGEPFAFERPVLSAEIERRRRDAHQHRLRTLAALRDAHPEAVLATGAEDTTAHIERGAPLIVTPHLGVDEAGWRRSNVHALVRVGRLDDRFSYAPLLIKNLEVVESASTRRVLKGSLTRVSPSDADYAEGVGVRSSMSVTRNGLALAHSLRVLESWGCADPKARGALVDRNGAVWWFELGGTDYARFNLAVYDELYAQRLAVLKEHDRWLLHGGAFPTSPYWHRECLDCPYSQHCERELEAYDDVSLTRFTNVDQQLLLREHGVTTRVRLARLDPKRAHLARRKLPTPNADFVREDLLGRSIDKLDDLIYRARAHVHGESLRIVTRELMGCPTADVEVDVDMESYGDATYLWGGLVTLNRAFEDEVEGYHHFANWDRLSREHEASLFAEFWTWFSALRQRCRDSGRTFAGYCFWAQAEDGAMNRAVATGATDGPTPSDLDAFRRASPPEWIDLHELAKRQIQTEGPLGLKQLATQAGFRWRDSNPSGEASMSWYEVAIGDGPAAQASRQRILDYNEDDCRATRALRDWLNGPARDLAHRDELF